MLSRKNKTRRREPNLSGRPAMTYYRSGPADTPSPFKKSEKLKKHKSAAGRIFDWAVILAAIAFVVYALTLGSNPKTVVDSTAYHQAAVYNDAADQIASGLKYRNKLTFDDSSLAAELKKRFPEVSGVSSDISLLSREPKLHISVAKPSLLFLGTAGTFGADWRMVIDANGTVVGDAKDFPNIKDLPTIFDDTGFGARKGEAALSRSDVDFILTVIAQAKRASVPIKSLTFPQSAQELDIRTKDKPYFVKFYLGGDPLVQSGQFLAARHRFDQQNKQPNKYLDVRVSGKIFYN